MKPGTVIDYQLRLFHVPFHWKTRIETFEPRHYFTDVQIAGPYRLWHHRHKFSVVPAGTLIHDIVEYELPLGPLEILRTCSSSGVHSSEFLITADNK